MHSMSLTEKSKHSTVGADSAKSWKQSPSTCKLTCQRQRYSSSNCACTRIMSQWHRELLKFSSRYTTISSCIILHVATRRPRQRESQAHHLNTNRLHLSINKGHVYPRRYNTRSFFEKLWQKTLKGMWELLLFSFGERGSAWANQAINKSRREGYICSDDIVTKLIFFKKDPEQRITVQWQPSLWRSTTDRGMTNCLTPQAKAERN